MPHTKQHLSEPQMESDPRIFRPARIFDLELSQPLPNIDSYDCQRQHSYNEAQILVRLHSRPLGVVNVPLDDTCITPGAYAPLIWQALGREINNHLRGDGLSQIEALDLGGIPILGVPHCNQVREALLTDPPFVSIIVATRDRPQKLEVCLRALVSLSYPNYEIIIVDTPTTSATHEIVARNSPDFPRLSYIREDHPNLSLARNRGLDAARGEIVFFTDDDTVPDTHCLAEVALAFKTHPRVACVTGLIFPLELETQAQYWFENHTASGKGFSPQLFDLGTNRPTDVLFPYTGGVFGAGVHRAFRTSTLREIGGFDPALGPGSLARAAEDFDVYFRILISGYQIFYEPGNLVYHAHRLDNVALEKQIYAYYIGLAAFLMKCIINRPMRLFELLAKLPYGFFYIMNQRSPKNQNRARGYPKYLIYTEYKGLFWGTFSLVYLRSYRKWNQVKRSFVAPVHPG